jgi:dephospho-CoA kinase
MQVLGIIGGIGGGKSTASAMFRQLGAEVICADDIGHQALLVSDVKKAAQERWGSVVFGDDSEMDRRKLAAVVFADEKELDFLKSLTHPLIADEVHRQREEHERNGVQLCLLDAPLLLEAGWEHLVDKIIFIDAPAEVRWHRVKSRGWSETEWLQRETAQLSVEEKRCRADVILDNSGDMEHLRTQVEVICTLRLSALSYNKNGIE